MNDFDTIKTAPDDHMPRRVWILPKEWTDEEEFHCEQCGSRAVEYIRADAVVEHDSLKAATNRAGWAIMRDVKRIPR